MGVLPHLTGALAYNAVGLLLFLGLVGNQARVIQQLGHRFLLLHVGGGQALVTAEVDEGVVVQRHHHHALRVLDFSAQRTKGRRRKEALNQNKSIKKFTASASIEKGKGKPTGNKGFDQLKKI